MTIRTRMASSHSEGDFSSLPPEPQQGNIEYKLKLVNPTSQRLEHLVTQMKWRLREGQGKVFVTFFGKRNGIGDVSSISPLFEPRRRLRQQQQ